MHVAQQILKQSLSSSKVATDAPARVGIAVKYTFRSSRHGTFMWYTYVPWILALSCTCYTLLSSGIFPNNAKFQRPITPKRLGVSSSQMGIIIISNCCLSDGANPMIVVYSNMELQLLKHTSLPPAIWIVIFGLPWLLEAKASGLQTLQMCL